MKTNRRTSCAVLAVLPVLALTACSQVSNVAQAENRATQTTDSSQSETNQNETGSGESSQGESSQTGTGSAFSELSSSGDFTDLTEGDIQTTFGIGNPLPSAEVTTIDGNGTINLADLKGPMVLNLWASWCEPCRTETPLFERVSTERASEITFVGLDVFEDVDTAQDFVDEFDLTYTQYVDIDGTASDALKMIGMPTSIFIDKDGIVVSRTTGEMNESELNEAIDEAVGK